MDLGRDNLIARLAEALQKEGITMSISSQNLTRSSFTSQGHTTEVDQTQTTWKHLSLSVPVSTLAVASLIIMNYPPPPRPHDVGTGLSAMLYNFSWGDRDKFTPERVPERAQTGERAPPEFSVASQ